MRIFPYLLLFFLLNSCYKNSYIPPKNLISEDQMVDILFEFMIVNGVQGANKKLMDMRLENPVNRVFEKYDIDSIQFESSNAYYARNLNIYSDIYDRVKQRLEAKKNDLQQVLEIEKRKTDSLRKIKKDSMNQLRKDRPISKRNRPLKNSVLPAE